jgi:hypothetical protein
MAKAKSAFVVAKYRYEAKKQCPWATIIMKFDGGFKCFETKEAFDAWVQG